MTLSGLKGAVAWMQPVLWAGVAAIGATGVSLANGNDWKVSIGAGFGAFVAAMQLCQTKRLADTSKRQDEIGDNLATNTRITKKTGEAVAVVTGPVVKEVGALREAMIEHGVKCPPHPEFEAVLNDSKLRKLRDQEAK